jgi:hypothetical protein
MLRELFEVAYSYLLARANVVGNSDSLMTIFKEKKNRLEFADGSPSGSFIVITETGCVNKHILT